MATTEFTGFTDETLAFLAALKMNNSKIWFDENRKTYDAAVKSPAKAFSELMAGELENLTGSSQKPKIFRINRDVRFSRDKTPYNTHIHMSWLPAGGGDSGPAFMFGLSTDYCTVGCGVFEFSKPALENWRKKIAGPQGMDFAKRVAKLAEEGYRVQEPALKRIPAGFPADHPNAELSLHKGFAVWRDLEGPTAATGQDIMARCLEHFESLMPIWKFISGLSEN